MQEEFKRIPLKNIIPDPNQPRKHFDEAALTELAHSISQYDVIEPIMVRPLKSKNSEKYMLVVGERRFRAAGMAMLLDIPATIRKLTDAEALEVQITENLQRENVNPMEEADALNNIIKSGVYKAKELAARIAKPEKYVRQRMKLCDLIPGFQDLVYADKLLMSQANNICKFSADVQQSFYDSYVPKDWREKPAGWKLREVHFSNTTHNLDEAPFKTEDPDLHKKMGPCGRCRFNSAYSELPFEGRENQRICSNPSCYEIKVKNAFNQKLKEVASDDSIVMVSQYAYSDNAKEKLKAAEAAVGRPVVQEGGWEILREPKQPEQPQYETFKKDYEEMWSDDAEELAKLEDNWKDELQQYQDEMLDWQDDVVTYQNRKQHATRAFVVNGNSEVEGQMIDVYIPGATDGAGQQDLTLQKKIDELREKNKAAIEKDKLALLKGLQTHLVELNAYNNREEQVELVEWLAMFYVLFTRAGYGVRVQILKEWGTENMKPQQLLMEIRHTGRMGFLFRWVRRMLLTDLCTGNFEYNTDGLDASNFLVSQIANRYVPGYAEEVRNEVKQKAEARLAKMNEKIAALRQTEISVEA